MLTSILIMVGSLGLAGLTALPAAATAGRAARSLSSSPPVDRFNVGATHSPQLLQQLAGQSSPLGTVKTSPGAVITAPTALPGAAQGVDVASYQHPNGAAIDWTQVYGDGIRFAAVKATEGAYYTNPYAVSDLSAASAAGLSTVAYAFAIPNGGSSGTTQYSSSPVVQADDLINYLTSNGLAVSPVMLDIEYDPYADGTNQCYGLSQSAMVSWISAFDAEVKAKTHRLPIIYAPPGWWSTCTGGSTAFGQVPIWVPDYASSSSPTLPAGWSTWNFWQYSSAGTVAGIQTPKATDLDQLNPAVITLLNAGNRKNVAGTTIGQQQVTPFTVSPAPALTFTAAGLPAGLSMDAGTGQITGWPDTPGTYHATVTASDGGGTTGSAPFTWTVTAAPTAGPAGPVQLDLAGKCLNDVGNSSANGTAQDIWTCNGSAAQHWTVVQDGTLRIHGKCLDVYHGGTTNGTKVDLYSCNGSVAQQWQVRTGGKLVNPHSGKCLTDPSGSTTNGTRVKIWSCGSYSYQKWRLPAGPVVSLVPGKCVNDDGNQTTNGNKIDIWTCNGTAAQAWTVYPNDTARIHGKCLDVYQGGTASGTKVDLYTCNGTAAQRWYADPAGPGVELINPQSGLCLSDPGNTTADGTGLVIGTCTGARGETWRIR